jgi:hypothetical protein
MHPPLSTIIPKAEIHQRAVELWPRPNAPINTPKRTLNGGFVPTMGVSWRKDQRAGPPIFPPPRQLCGLRLQDLGEAHPEAVRIQQGEVAQAVGAISSMTAQARSRPASRRAKRGEP